MPARDHRKHKETHSTPGTVAVTRHAFHRALEIPTIMWASHFNFLGVGVLVI
jgi:hypothetical protein